MNHPNVKDARVRYEFKDDTEWIRVIDFFPERHRYLHFHESIQGVMSLEEEAQPILEYIGLMFETARFFQQQPYRVLVGGLGSCTLLHAVTEWLGSHSRVIAVENNSMILDLGKRFFRLDPRQKVLMGDLRDQLNAGYLDRLDLAFIDCYTSESMPFHLMTLEFAQTLYACMQQQSLAIFNIWSPDCNPLCPHQLKTLATCFDEVAFIKGQEDQNFVVLVRKEERESVDAWPRSIMWKRRDYPVRVLHASRQEDWKGFLYGARIIEDANLDQFVRLAHEFLPR